MSDAPSDSAALSESAARADDNDARNDLQVTAMTSVDAEACRLLHDSHVHTIRRPRAEVSTRKMHALELDAVLRSERLYLPIGSRRRTRRMRSYRFKPIDPVAAVTQVAEQEVPERREITTVKIERLTRPSRRLPLAPILVMISVLLAYWFL
jgi:hypothetical protein